MKLALMQPYPFPYIGYFELMARVDRWIVFDVAQYTKQSWMNRNRILHPVKGWQYVSIPVGKKPQGTLISSMCLVDRLKAEKNVLARLQHYHHHAPFYHQVADLVRDTFSRTSTNGLVDFNVASLMAAAERLAIPFAPELCSRLGLNLDHVEHAGQWALRIAIQLGASTYLNPPGGRGIFRPEEWEAAGIELAFTEMNGLRYECPPYVFEPNLSILDVLMWNSAGEIQAWLRKRTAEPVVSAHH